MVKKLFLYVFSFKIASLAMTASFISNLLSIVQ